VKFVTEKELTAPEFDQLMQHIIHHESQAQTPWYFHSLVRKV